MLNSSQVEGLEKKYNFLLLVHPCVFDPADLDANEEFLAVPTRHSMGPTASRKPWTSGSAVDDLNKPRGGGL